MRPSVLGFFVPKRGRNVVAVLIFLFITPFIYLVAIRLQKPADSLAKPFREDELVLTRENLGIGQCPVCFGLNEPLCGKLVNLKVKLRSKERDLPVIGRDLWKIGAHAVWNNNKILVKHVGNFSKFHSLDTEICSSLSNVHTGCNVTEVVWKSFLNPPSIERAIGEHLDCPSRRFLSKIQETYVSRKSEHLPDHQRLHLTTALNLDQEPLILQVFSAEQGWPFPKFYGACGRTVVVEDVGTPLDSFLHYPWIQRAKLAIEVLKIAKRLTVNRERWGLYFTEVTQDSFAVSNGTVKLTDADGFVVVDLSAAGIRAENKKTVHSCSEEDPYCLSFVPHELCRGTVRDHNYYAVCRRVLSDVQGRLGLLHSPPDSSRFGARLEDALTECVSAQTIRRGEAVELIIGLLRGSIAQQQGA